LQRVLVPLANSRDTLLFPFDLLLLAIFLFARRDLALFGSAVFFLQSPGLFPGCLFLAFLLGL
jgi:hypothetical protein